MGMIERNDDADKSNANNDNPIIKHISSLLRAIVNCEHPSGRQSDADQNNNLIRLRHNLLSILSSLIEIRGTEINEL